MRTLPKAFWVRLADPKENNDKFSGVISHTVCKEMSEKLSRKISLPPFFFPKMAPKEAFLFM